MQRIGVGRVLGAGIIVGALVLIAILVPQARATDRRTPHVQILAARNVQTPNYRAVCSGQQTGFNPYILERVEGVAGDTYMFIPTWYSSSIGDTCNFRAVRAQLVVHKGRWHVRWWPPSVFQDSAWVDLSAASDSLPNFPLKGVIDSLLVRITSTGYGDLEGY